MIDFDIFQSRLQSEVVRLYNTFPQHEKICSVALYTDPGGMTLCMSVNTEDYLRTKIRNNPQEKCYYKWVPDAWRYSYVESSELDFLSTILSGYILNAEDNTDFDLFMESLVERSILSLEYLKEVTAGILDNTVLLFTISDFDDPLKKLQWIKDLNTEKVVQEYVRCMDEL